MDEKSAESTAHLNEGNAETPIGDFNRDVLHSVAQAKKDLALSSSIDDMGSAFATAITRVEESWSGSNVGQAAHMYYGNFEIPPAGERWSRRDGAQRWSPNWRERTLQEVTAEVERQAGHDLGALRQRTKELIEKIEENHQRLNVLFARVPNEVASRFGIEEKRSRLADLRLPGVSEEKPSSSIRPKSSLGHARSWQTEEVPHETIRDEVESAIAAAATARDLVRLAELAEASATRWELLGERSPRSTDSRWEIRVQASAVAFTALEIFAVCLWRISKMIVDIPQKVAAEESVTMLRVVAGAVGALGIVTLVFGSYVAYLGIVHVDGLYLTKARDKALKWGVGAGGAAGLAFMFGIT